MSEPSSTFDRLQQARAAALALKEGEPGYESAVAGVLLAEVAHRAWAAAHDQPASTPWARSTVPNVGGVRRLLLDALGENSARKRAVGRCAERSDRGGHQGERRPSRWASSSAGARRGRGRALDVAPRQWVRKGMRVRVTELHDARVIAARDAAAVVLRCDDGASFTAAEADRRAYPTLADPLTDGEHEGAVGVLSRHDAPARRVTVDLGTDVVVECGASCVCSGVDSGGGWHSTRRSQLRPFRLFTVGGIDRSIPARPQPPPSVPVAPADSDARHQQVEAAEPRRGRRAAVHGRRRRRRRRGLRRARQGGVRAQRRRLEPGGGCARAGAQLGGAKSRPALLMCARAPASSPRFGSPRRPAARDPH